MVVAFRSQCTLHVDHNEEGVLDTSGQSTLLERLRLTAAMALGMEPLTYIYTHTFIFYIYYNIYIYAPMCKRNFLPFYATARNASMQKGFPLPTCNHAPFCTTVYINILSSAEPLGQ